MYEHVHMEIGSFGKRRPITHMGRSSKKNEWLNTFEEYNTG